MRGVAIERWTFTKTQEVTQWLTTNFNTPTKDTWYIDRDFDLKTLTMTEQIYMVYLLRWT